MITSYRDHFDGQHVIMAHSLIAQHAEDSDVDWLRDKLSWFVDTTVDLLDGPDNVAALVLAIKVRLALAAGLVPSET